MSDVTTSVPGRPGDREATTGPPVLFLLLAAAGLAVAVALSVVGGVGANIGGYVSSSILTVVLVGLYRRVDLTRRLRAGYQARPGVARVIPLLLVAAFALAGVHVWSLATEWAS